MDDNSFDKIVRSRLQSYNDPESDYNFGPLKSRLGAAAPKSGLRGFILGSIATMLFLTGVNFYLTFYYQRPEQLNTATVNIDSLINVINELKAKSIKVERGPVTIEAVDHVNDRQAHKDEMVTYDSIVATTQSPSLHYHQSIYDHKSDLSSFQDLPDMPTVRFIVVNKTVAQPAKPWRHPEISAKIKNQLERHYFKGIGINVAPDIQLGGMLFDRKPSPYVGLGFGADWILSPHLSVETGARYSVASHSVATANSLYGSLNDKYYGSPLEVKQSDDLVSGSVLFAYRQWLTDRDQLKVKLGVTSYKAVRGRYNIKYAQRDHYDVDDYGYISQVQKIEGIRSFANTISFSTGISRQVSKNQTLELSGFYEHGFGSNIRFFGIRSALWFKVR